MGFIRDAMDAEMAIELRSLVLFGQSGCALLVDRSWGLNVQSTGFLVVDIGND